MYRIIVHVHVLPDVPMRVYEHEHVRALYTRVSYTQCSLRKSSARSARGPRCASARSGATTRAARAGGAATEHVARFTPAAGCTEL
eukprot:COSAG02_NODE_3231_length_7137_cov_32.345411_3_plen_86_part_00